MYADFVIGPLKRRGESPQPRASIGECDINIVCRPGVMRAHFELKTEQTRQMNYICSKQELTIET